MSFDFGMKCLSIWSVTPHDSSTMQKCGILDQLRWTDLNRQDCVQHNSVHALMWSTHTHTHTLYASVLAAHPTSCDSMSIKNTSTCQLSTKHTPFLWADVRLTPGNTGKTRGVCVCGGLRCVWRYQGVCVCERCGCVGRLLLSGHKDPFLSHPTGTKHSCWLTNCCVMWRTDITVSFGRFVLVVFVMNSTDVCVREKKREILSSTCWEAGEPVEWGIVTRLRAAPSAGYQTDLTLRKHNLISELKLKG